MGVKGIRLSNKVRGAKQDSQNQDVIDCVVEDSESTKQETTKWQPGSAQAQFGVRGSYKNLLFKKFLWVSLNHHSWWGCHY
ncbi:hypothetical protein [Nostoc sp.]|uniref:hypothetical protein n=1 Tax=Nostoc sp. TaxID=1180 RepID=UPI002FFAC7E6